MYKELKVEHKLRPVDDVSLPYSCVCLVGQTEVLDPEDFPQIKEEIAQMRTVLGLSTMCTVRVSSSLLRVAFAAEFNTNSALLIK